MDQKVTRRAAIGTIIGGVVAAPVAYYFLKGGDTVKPPGPKFQKAWSKSVKMFDIPVNEISGPSTITLDCRPRVGAKYRMISLLAFNDSRSYPAEYPQPPLAYIFTDAQIAAISPIVPGRPALLIRAEKQIFRRRDSDNTIPGGECVVVPRKDNGGLDYFEPGQGAPKKILLEKVNWACRTFGSYLTFNYPKGKAMAKGEKWTIPRALESAIPTFSDYPVELPCEIVGFAKIEGWETMKINVERHCDNKEIQEMLNWQIQQTKNEEERKWLKEYLQRVVDDERSDEFHITSYVDLKTGLNVRYEERLTSHIPKAPNDGPKDVFISQLLEG
jgi:hypothetical protein